jgi:Ger(x)C family germination protein
MRKKIAALALTLAMPLTLSGCWTSNEVNRLAIVMGIGVDSADAAEDGFRVTLQIAQPGRLKAAGVSGQDAYFNVYSSGQTMQLRMSEFERMLSREVYTGHTEMAVIGEDAARNGLGQVMEYFFRSPEARISVPMIIARGKASDMLGMAVKLEKLPVTRLAGMISTQLSDTLDTAAERVTLESFMSAVKSRTAATVPLFGRYGEDSVEILGMAVFDGAAMVGELDTNQSRTMLALRNKYRGGIEWCELPGGGMLTYVITGSEAKLRPKYEDGGFSMEVSLNAEFVLSEETRQGEQADLGARLEIERLVSEALTERIADTLSHSRELGADVCGFGDAIYRKYPGESRELLSDWGSAYRYLPVSITVDTVMYSSGATIKSIAQ